MVYCQIIDALNGDQGEVELRTVGTCVPGKVIVKDPAGDNVQLEKAENQLHDDEAAEELASVTGEEAPVNPILALIDMLTYISMASSNSSTKSAENSVKEDIDPTRAVDKMYNDVFRPLITELAKLFEEFLHLINFAEEVQPATGASTVGESSQAEQVSAKFHLLPL